jgi:FAD synthase
LATIIVLEATEKGILIHLKQFASIYHFNVEEIPAQEINQLNVSSTRIRKAIEEGDVKTANEFFRLFFFCNRNGYKRKTIRKNYRLSNGKYFYRRC